MTVGLRPRDNSPDTLASAVFEQVRRALPPASKCELVLDSSLYEVGLDSLARMEVLNCLEEAFGVRFTEESLNDMETCRDVVEYIELKMGCGASRRSAVNSDAAAGPRAAAPPRANILPRSGDATQFPECVAFHQRLADSAAAGLDIPFFRSKDQVVGSTATIAGREVVSYTSFDYLGLGGHARVTTAAKDAIDRFGTSASASRLVGGNHAIVQQLDDELARFLGTEAAIVFPCGYGTNASIFGHLFGCEDLILYDELAHNSIVQGAMLSQAQQRSFRHNDCKFLDDLLADVRAQYRRVVIAVEGLYSMDGDYPDLPRLIEIKQRHQALLYVDEAHSIGVMGWTGRGICEHFGVDPEAGDLWMGTISKALGSGGGYLAGRKMLMQYLKYTTPAFVFSTAVSPANAAAALEALRILRQEPARVAQLRQRSQLFLKLAVDCGLNTGHSRDTPIIPVILGDSHQCMRVVAALLQEGIDAQPILYPAVPENKSRIRFFITAEHTEEQICRTVQVLAECIAVS